MPFSEDELEKGDGNGEVMPFSEDALEKGNQNGEDNAPFRGRTGKRMNQGIGIGRLDKSPFRGRTGKR